nr:alginate export family protein [Granulicella sibirica]
MTLDMDLRTRTENQTAINYVPGNWQVYELTRVRIGLEVRPARWLTAYLQGQDTHALGLPLPYVAANMRNTFDARQAYLNFHVKPVTIIAGRQGLKYGGERLVGISNWTNNSRTWDGFLGRIGDKNRLDVFSTSVVTVHPTSLDKHGAGLNFHGAAGTITTWVPHTTITPFVFVRSVRQVTSQQGVVGGETEATPGIEADGDLGKGWDYHALGALQRGSYSNDSIHSGAGFAKVGYTATHCLETSPSRRVQLCHGQRSSKRSTGQHV